MEETQTSSTEARKKLESSQAHTKIALEKTAEAARAVGETVKKHAQDVYTVGKEHLGAAAKDLGEAASCTMEELRSQANTMIAQAGEKVKNFQSQTEEYIRSNPLQAVGVAFAVGFLLGLVSRR
jgi:ElaB/YqjD/DUF883 family membrane-anchored ribosome-binding protein